MSVSVVDGPAIIIGYEYRLQIEAGSALFPAGATFAGQLRTRVSASGVLATLTTASGGLIRRSDTVLELIIPPGDTERLVPGSAVVDLVRTDLVPPRHLAFILEIPVVQPVTRGSG
mgnify:FL=1